MLTNGSTAIDWLEIFDGAVGGLVRKRLKASRPAATTPTPTMKVANFRRLQVGNAAATSGGTSSVRFKPSGVASNAQEINTTSPNPSANRTTNAFITQDGASNVGSKIDPA